MASPRAYPDSAYVFVSERRAPLRADAVRKIVGRPGREAGIEFPIHPRMLRHATSYKPANDGQDKRAIQHLSGTPQHSAYVIPSYIFRGDGQVIDLDAILAGLELG